MDSNSSSSQRVTPLRKPVKCPNCSSMSNREAYPFCSPRCKDVDLNRWFNQSYAIPVTDDDQSMDENS